MKRLIATLALGLSLTLGVNTFGSYINIGGGGGGGGGDFKSDGTVDMTANINFTSTADREITMDVAATQKNLVIHAADNTTSGDAGMVSLRPGQNSSSIPNEINLDFGGSYSGGTNYQDWRYQVGLEYLWLKGMNNKFGATNRDAKFYVSTGGGGTRGARIGVSKSNTNPETNYFAMQIESGGTPYLLSSGLNIGIRPGGVDNVTVSNLYTRFKQKVRLDGVNLQCDTDAACDIGESAARFGSIYAKTLLRINSHATQPTYGLELTSSLIKRNDEPTGAPLTIRSGNATSGGSVGGALNIKGGDGKSAGPGGWLKLTPGNSPSTVNVGSVAIYDPKSSTTYIQFDALSTGSSVKQSAVSSGGGVDLTIKAGDTGDASDGGDLILNGGTSTGGTNGGVHIPNMKTGTTQALAGAVAGELWADSDDAYTVKFGQ